MITKDQFDRLPAYLKSEIAALRNQIVVLEEEVRWRKDEDRIKAEASNTVVVEGIDHRTPIKSFSDVEFTLADPSTAHWRPTITCRVTRDGKRLEVMGADPLVISPWVANHIYIELADA